MVWLEKNLGDIPEGLIPLGRSDDKLPAAGLDNGSTCLSTCAPRSVLGEHYIHGDCIQVEGGGASRAWANGREWAVKAGVEGRFSNPDLAIKSATIHLAHPPI